MESINSVEGKSFIFNLVEENPEIDFNQSWSWSPKKQPSSLNIKTATFSGKNKADDYTNE